MSHLTTILDKFFVALSNVLAQFPLTPSETELVSYHQKVNLLVATELLNDLRLKILRN